MSKLFETINRIEAGTAQGVVESPFGKDLTPLLHPARDGALLRRLLSVAVIFLFFVSGGLGVLFFSRTLSQLQAPVMEKPADQATKETQSALAHVPRKEESPAPKEALPESKVELKKGYSAIRSQVPVGNGKTGKSSSVSITSENSIMPFEKAGPFSRELSRKKQLASVSVNPLVLSLRQKKFLYQAEKLRKEGRLDQALELYRKIWNKTPNPLVANNIAAVLMGLGHYSEARDVLESALKISPNDQDIKFNLAQLNMLLHDNGFESGQ